MSKAFTGFPQAGLDFLAQLERNNEKSWFEAHKDVYQSSIVQPALRFVVAMGERLQTVAPTVAYDTRTNGAGSLMRIYRDVRFSKDKTPYKTWVGIVFWDGPRKKNENPGFYFGFSATGGGAHAGLYSFPPDLLSAYRTAVDEERLGAELETAVTAVRTAGPYTINGEHYKTVPRGYDREHPRANWLRFNALYASSPLLEPAVLASPELLDACFAHFRNMAPLQQWLVRVSQTV